MKKKLDGSWQRISWDEALDTIVDKLKEIKEKYGAQALAVYSGSIGTENIELAGFAQRFRGVYGTPNLLSVEGNCFRSRIMARQMTFGSYPIEEPWNAACLIVWGQNMDKSRMTIANKIYKAMEAGTLKHLIVIDPKRTSIAEKGMHVQIRPGTDDALALGLLNVIVTEGLEDKKFIAEFTSGYDKLVEHVKEYTPEKVAEITWVPAEDIRKIARLFATTKPACINPGTCSIDQHINGFQTNRALALLQIVTGNVDVKGGWVSIPFIRLGDLRVPEVGEPVGAETFPLFRRFWGRTSPYGQEMSFADAVLAGKPYYIKAMICQGGNPALTLPDAVRTQQALKKLDFLVTVDLFMTDTAKLSDIVLPACTHLEKGGVGYVYGVNTCIPYALLRKKVVEPVGESWPDWRIWTELGRRMGYAEQFPWNTEEEVIDFFLKPSGLTREQLDEEHPEGVFYIPEKKYVQGGYRTPSGKIEIYSQTLQEAGYDPIPRHVEPSQSPVSAPELAEKFPLILTTGARLTQYTHTQFRNIPVLRGAAAEPIAEIHPKTAAKFGVSDGDMIALETVKGQIKLRANTSDTLHEGIVSIPHGWSEANSNMLTHYRPCDPVTGYTEMKALLCRIHKVPDSTAVPATKRTASRGRSSKK
jgi:anaerobic selenocysteine-containing dehydrogenase